MTAVTRPERNIISFDTLKNYINCPPVVRKSRTCTVCPICFCKWPNRNDLQSHLAFEHSVVIETENLNFSYKNGKYICKTVGLCGYSVTDVPYLRVTIEPV